MSRRRLRLLPPFQIGTTLRFKGSATTGCVVDGVTYWMEPGMVCKVVGEFAADPGTGWHTDGEGKRWCDRGDDACSVVEWPFMGHTSLIRHEWKGEWEVIA